LIFLSTLEIFGVLLGRFLQNKSLGNVHISRSPAGNEKYNNDIPTGNAVNGTEKQ
jgi:hypothetical protein